MHRSKNSVIDSEVASVLMKWTRRFELKMLFRPEVEWEWCTRVINSPAEVIEQGDGTFRMWGYIEEAENICE